MKEMFLILIYGVAIIFGWYCWTTLAKRLGYESPGWIGFGMVLPIINFFVFLSLVFSESPNEKKLRGDGKPEPSPDDAKPDEKSAENLTEQTEQAGATQCPACGAAISPDHVHCPSCDIYLK